MSRERAYRILILGGYGHFGGRIAQALANRQDCHLFIAGRDESRARQAAANLRESGALASVEGAQLDTGCGELSQRIREHRADLVIHTAGPFQRQSYHVALACIEAGANYIDLADGREFVAGITALDAAARERGVLVVSGASTLPALSSAVVDHYQAQFKVIASIGIGITPGNRTPRGLSTVAAVLSYCGKAFDRWQNSRWEKVHGWQDLHRFHYPRLGARWLASCDVPDLALFPRRYQVAGRVTFHAGMELSVIQLGLWLMSWLTRWRLVRSWVPAARVLKATSDQIIALGTDAGAMHVDIAGVDLAGKPKRILWLLTALNGDGPKIPCIAAIVLARKLADGRLSGTGAQACTDLMTLAEFDAAVSGLAIGWEERSQEADKNDASGIGEKVRL